MTNLSNREKILLVAVFVGVAYFVNAFFISKEKDLPSVNPKNLEDLKSLMGNVARDIETLSLSTFDNQVITRAQAEWVRDPFPDKQFFLRPLVTSDELEERRKSAALRREEMRERQKAEGQKKIDDEKMKKEAFFRYDVDLSRFDEKEFEKIELEQQKDVLIECLDKNHLYVNLSEMDDATYKITGEEKEMNRKFYGL